MAGGPDGSNFQRVAEQYQKILARSGIDLKIEPSHGSADSLAMMAEHTVDVALVQAGVTRKDGTDDIVSLGTMFRQPVMIFYRASKPITLLSQLDGERIAVGHAGSGTQVQIGRAHVCTPVTNAPTVCRLL